MEGVVGLGSGQVVTSVVKKKRSSSIRRPRQASPLHFGSRDPSPFSSTSSDNMNKLSPDDSSGYDGNSRRKEIYINYPPPKVTSVSKFDDAAPSRKKKKDDKGHGDFDPQYASGVSRDKGRNGSDVKRSSEGVLAPSNWKSLSKFKDNSELQSLSPEHFGHNLHQSPGTSSISGESKLKKVKLKVGGVTRTITAKSNVETSNSIGSSSMKFSRSSDGSRYRSKIIPQDNSDANHSPREKGHGSRGDPWKDDGGTNSGMQDDQYDDVPSEPIRKSRRVPKRRILDGEFDDGEEDDEIRYIERSKISKNSDEYTAENERDVEDGPKKKKLSILTKSRGASYVTDDGDYELSRMAKDSRKRSRTVRFSEDSDYIEEDEPVSDDNPEEKKKKLKKLAFESSSDVRLEPLTTRQRALHPGKDGNGLNIIEFPDGLPPAPPRKQKQKLSEVEEQAKKAEAAQRRKMQVEKAARESEAAAIRKILGLDSDKKKAEKEKAQAEKAKAANSHTREGSSIRWIMGPNGTVVTFPDSVGLPSLFDSKPCSYPPPREQCAGPSCTNPYKYRDSKSNLPLCSLQCYKAIHGSSNHIASC